MSATTSNTPWDKLSDSYLEIESDGTGFPIPERYLPQADSCVLDLGCGVGTHMRLFQTKTEDVFGIDLSHRMVKEAAKVAPVAQANSLELPFKNGSFDYLWSRVVISCVPNWEQAFEEALRVVKPGGRLVILVANKWSVAAPFRCLLSRLGRYSEGYIQHLSKGDFQSHKTEHKFQIKEAFAVQKPARSSNALFSLLAKVFYTCDKTLTFVMPWWGGDLCVVIERTK